MGAFGPNSFGLPKPCRATNSVARSSDRVVNHACPPALQDNLTSMPMSRGPDPGSLEPLREAEEAVRVEPLLDAL